MTPWDESWKGWWSEDPPYHLPVFVLTHHPREPLPMQGGTTFTFVTAPVILGAGERLLENVGDPTLEPIDVVASPAVTHVNDVNRIGPHSPTCPRNAATAGHRCNERSVPRNTRMMQCGIERVLQALVVGGEATRRLELLTPTARHRTRFRRGCSARRR